MEASPVKKPVEVRGNSSTRKVEIPRTFKTSLKLNQNIIGDSTNLDDLYKTKQIVKIIKYSIISAQIKEQPPTAPLSPWLIAPTEHNKTRILLKFLKALYTAIIENLSDKPLNKLIKEQDKKQTVHHLIVLDLERVLAHPSVVSKAVFGTLLNLLDEGVQTSLYYGQTYHLKHRIRMGIITALTPEIFKQHFGTWNKTGHLTRILPISWKYSDSTRNDINRYIRQELPKIIDETTASIKRRGKQTVTINNPDVACAIQLLSEQLTERLRKFHVTRQTKYGKYKVYFDIEGFRLHKMLRLLAKAIAYDKDRNEVNYEDLAELKELSDFIRLPDNPKEV